MSDMASLFGEGFSIGARWSTVSIARPVYAGQALLSLSYVERGIMGRTEY
jgi:hypothetical protein